MNFWDVSDGRGKDIYERYASYGGKSEDELTRELREKVARMKAEGTFDPAALENLYNTAYPFLNEAQRQRMRGIIDMLNG